MATSDASHSFRLGYLLAALLALAYAVPIASDAYDRLMRVNERARERLIQQHRLWELHPEFRGKPEVWTRMASRLLNDRQVLARLAAKYGAQADPIETEFRRDVAIARAEVVIVALAVWALPIALASGAVWLRRRRTRAPPAKVPPASASDPRYLPPDRR